MFPGLRTYSKTSACGIGNPHPVDPNFVPGMPTSRNRALGLCLVRRLNFVGVSATPFSTDIVEMGWVRKNDNRGWTRRRDALVSRPVPADFRADQDATTVTTASMKSDAQLLWERYSGIGIQNVDNRPNE